MRIGIDIRAIGRQRTGDETYTLNLVKNLLKIDRKNQYFFYTNTANEKELEKIENKINPANQFKNCKIIPVLPAGKMFWTFWFLPRYLAKNPVDILHVQYITPLWLPKKIKLITTIHDVSFKALPELINKSDLLFLKTLIPLSLKRADKIIAVSKFTENEINKYYPAESSKIQMIFNGGADEKFYRDISDIEKERVKKTYNLKWPFLFYVGTLQPRKNIPFLLKAFEQLKIESQNNEKIKNLELVLSGKKDDCHYDVKIDLTLEEIRKTNPEVAESIKFADFVPEENLPILYKLSEACLFPSKYEGFGLPAIESMAVGTPVLCSNSSCFEEITSEASLIFKQDDKNDFTKKMFDITINKELRESLKGKGKQRAQFFAWEKCARETLGIYQAL